MNISESSKNVISALLAKGPWPGSAVRQVLEIRGRIGKGEELSAENAKFMLMLSTKATVPDDCLNNFVGLLDELDRIMNTTSETVASQTEATGRAPHHGVGNSEAVAMQIGS